jgi:mono/diheme cytochrome c family protein
MIHRTLAGIGLSLTLPLTIAIAAESPSERGKVIFEQRCMICHGNEGRGDGAQAPYLSPRPGNLVSASVAAKTDQELLKVIAQGKPRTAMRGWSDVLTEKEQREVLHYIRSLVRFHRSSTPPPPSPAER